VTPKRCRIAGGRACPFDAPLDDPPAGRHTLTITAIDPDMELDQICLPVGATP